MLVVVIIGFLVFGVAAIALTIWILSKKPSVAVNYTDNTPPETNSEDWSRSGSSGSTAIVNDTTSPHAGLTKGGTLTYVKLKCFDCYNGTSIDFTSLDKLISDADPKTNVIVRLYFNNGKNENYLPDWMQNASDYTKRDTDLVDWGLATVRNSVLTLLAKLAAHLYADKRVALFQFGVGYWSELHVSGVDLKVGENWPTAEYMDQMAEVLEANAGDLQLAVSVGVGDMARPISDKFRTNTRFGLFYDTFLQNNGDAEPEYITTLYKNADWEARAKKCMIGGEFANNTPALTSSSLKKAQGFLDKRHMTYLLPNGTSKIMDSGSANLKVLSGSMGYGLKLTKAGSSFTATNTGVAPVFYDMYVYVGSTKLPTSLKGLQRGETRTCSGELTGTPVVKGLRYATDIPYTINSLVLT